MNSGRSAGSMPTPSKLRGVRDGRSAPLAGDDNSGCTAGKTLATGADLMEVPGPRSFGNVPKRG